MECDKLIVTNFNTQIIVCVNLILFTDIIQVEIIYIICYRKLKINHCSFLNTRLINNVYL